MAAERERISAYSEILEFLTSAPTPEQIVGFQPSELTQERVRYLLDASRNGTLTAEEHTEMNELGRIEHFMRMLKAYALDKIASP
jgi:hypothetical protein